MLTRWETAFLVDVYRTLLPSGAHPRLTLGAADMPLVPFTERWLRSVPWEARLGFRIALRLLAIAPLLTFTGLKPLRALDDVARIAVLERLSRHRVYLLRELPVIVKTVACTGYCAHPAVRRAIGFDDHLEGPPDWLSATPPPSPAERAS